MINLYKAELQDCIYQGMDDFETMPAEAQKKLVGLYLLHLSGKDRGDYLSDMIHLDHMAGQLATWAMSDLPEASLFLRAAAASWLMDMTKMVSTDIQADLDYEWANIKESA